jgi:hypothetical protein
MPNLFSRVFGTKPSFANLTNPTIGPQGSNPGSSYWQLGQIYPNLSQSIGTAAGNIQSQLSGQLPADVTADIKNQGAAWGLQTGMPGSGAADNYTLEDFGLTSLQEQQQGLANYLNFAPALQSMFTLNPEQLSAVDVGNAAPDPRTAGMEKIFSGIGGDLLGGIGAAA